ncbi:MAG: tRNA(adenine34) deaminase [Vezdaea aestivalis]|nr:MAG: tRNA(adenine34) deaminase [Vezdaea aestivalis]
MEGSNVEEKSGSEIEDDALCNVSELDRDHPAFPVPQFMDIMPDIADREYHEGFMKEALAMGELALQSDETPVGCVFVSEGKIIGRGMNDTNASLNGTRHAEFVAINEMLKMYTIEIFKKTDLFVTVEPCIMCASLLRQFGIRAVYFGCHNDRFGGTGGVLSVHSNSQDIDPPYPAYGGLFRAEAIMLLRRFYIRENGKAPEPRSKKNRALKTEILPIAGAPASEAAEADKENASGSSSTVQTPTPAEELQTVASLHREMDADAVVEGLTVTVPLTIDSVDKGTEAEDFKPGVGSDGGSGEKEVTSTEAVLKDMSNLKI